MTTRVDLFADVPGQERAVAELVAAAAAPVHAYLFLGPAGTNKDTAAIAFAAMILCEHGGCGTCATCQRVLTTGHPDLVVVEPVGVAYKVEELRTIGQVALRRPLEAQAAAMGERRVQGLSNLRDDHKREIRRYETVELTAGLGALARCYRDEMIVAAAADDDGRLRRATEAVTMISAFTSTWHRNPRAKLALERLFLDLGALRSAC